MKGKWFASRKQSDEEKVVFVNGMDKVMIIQAHDFGGAQNVR